jgi:cytochrome c553
MKRGRRSFVIAALAFALSIVVGSLAMAGGPPAQPANHAGRTGCAACHGAGSPKPMPAGHDAASNCAGCHAAPAPATP